MPKKLKILLKFAGRAVFVLLFATSSLLPPLSQFLPLPSAVQPQTAHAASGDVYLFWDQATSSLPAGWSCVSCGNGDPFFNVFIMASTSYNSATAGGPETVSHLLTFSTASNGASTSQETAATSTPVFPLDTHTHTWSATVTAESIIPPYQNLLVIKANNPSDLPNGTIGMFDVASASLPATWSFYASLSNNYLRGSNATTTGGASTHTHTTATTTSGNTSATLNDPQNGKTVASGTHNHKISTGSALSVDNNAPPFVNITFAKLTATTTLNSASNTGLIAIFDASPPSGWDQFSTSGNPTTGNLLKGAETFGGTGGNSTHNHSGSVTWTSQGPSATGNDRANTTAAYTALSTHTHNVTFTVAASTSMPIYREVILAKKTLLEQANYQWWINIDSITPTATLSALNATTTDVASGTIVRLRIDVKVSSAALAAGSQFKLQYATSTATSSDAWTDVGATDSTTTVWRGYDNNASSDGATLPSTLLASSTVAATYEELNPSNGTPTAVPVNGFGEWDWVLQQNGAAAGTTYYFRMVDANGNSLSQYTRYPAVVTQAAAAEPNLSQAHYRWRNNDGSETGATFIVATDTAISGINKRSLRRLRLSVKNTGDANATATRFKLQYGLMGASCASGTSYVDLVNTGQQQSQHFSLVNTANVNHSASTTDVSINGGVDNDSATFTAGQFISDTNLTGIIGLATNTITELEYSLWPEETANTGGTYCFRVLDSGSGLTITYTSYAKLTVVPSGKGGGSEATGGAPPSVASVGGGLSSGGSSSEGGPPSGGGNVGGGGSGGGGATP